MKVKAVQKLLHQATKHLTMEGASFNYIGCAADRPVMMKDGRLVTEDNVTEFIRERTELWRQTWPVGCIEEAQALIAADQPHPFVKSPTGMGWCDVCRKGPNLGLHRGF